MLVALVATMALAVVSTTAAQNESRQVGLVNVSTGNVDLLNGVNLAVAANVIATVCDVTVPIAVLATQVVDEDGATFCQATTAPITVTQSQPGDGGGTPNPNGGNRSRQAGLVNISLGDVAILNNLNLALAANLLITACDLKVPVAILAVQNVSDTGDTVCTTAAGPINIDQSQ
jgi:hypothetical protein